MITFSVIIPTHNYGHFLKRAIDSVLPQLNPEDEIIVMDDASTDHTEQVVKNYSKIHYHKLSAPARGPAHARNEGALLAQNDYLLFLDADDQLLSEALSLFRRYIYQHPYTLCVLSDQKIMSHDRQENFKHYIDQKLSICHGSFVIERNYFKTIRYPNSMKQREDMIFFAQLLAQTDCGYFAEPTVFVHHHEHSLRHQLNVDYDFSVENIVQKRFEDLIQQKLFLARFYLSLFRQFWQNKDYPRARDYYYRAFRYSPQQALRFQYLKKWIRCFSL